MENSRDRPDNVDMPGSSPGSAATPVRVDEVRLHVDDMYAVPQFFDGLAEGVAFYGLDGILTTGNVAARRMLGRSGRELIGTHWSAYVVPEDHEAVERFHRQVLETDAPAHFETQFLHADGSRIDVSVRLLPAHARGALLGFYALAIDVSAQKAMERAFLRSQQQLRSLFEWHPDAIVVFKTDGRFSRVNHATETITGYLSEELIGRDPSVLVTPDHIDEFRTMIARGEPATYESRFARKDGTVLLISGTAIPVLVDGKFEGMYCVARDVTEARRARAEFDTLATRIQQLYRLAATAPGATSEEQIATALRHGIEQLGYEWAYVVETVDDTLAVTYAEGSCEGHAVGHTFPLETAVLRHAIGRDEPFIVDDGSLAAVGISVGGVAYGAVVLGSARPHAPLATTDRDYLQALGALAAAAIERSRHRRELDALAFYDTLTGLPNRALLRSRIEEAIHGTRLDQQPFAIHFVDFDNFKPINDQYGHGMGDELLVAMARRLGEGLPAGDTLARYGGDEFVLVQRGVDGEESAFAFAQRVTGNLRRPFVAHGHEFTLTVSMGIALFPTDGETIEDLYHNADAALYRAKDAGRDRIVRYLPEMKGRL
jgi:diguanylate cyclase (GGDEF)-like protein/PAS domain S-box-containing protein